MSEPRRHYNHYNADLCAKNGWGVGTFLISDEGYGPTVIEIRYISDAVLVCRSHARCGREVRRLSEHPWTLSRRDWEEVPPLRTSEESL